jgi:hypothetical protein
MTSSGYERTFGIDPEFQLRYATLIDKIAAGEAYFPCSTLVAHLRAQLGCVAAAIVHCRHGRTLKLDVCSPDYEFTRVEDFLKNGENCVTGQRLSECLGFRFLTENDHGDTVFVRCPSQAIGSMEIDLIPIAPSLDSDADAEGSFRLLVLADSIQLAPSVNHRAYRDLQRRMLAQLVWGWCVRVTSPGRLLPSMDRRKELAINGAYHHPPWLDVATLPELLMFGIRVAATYRNDGWRESVETWEHFIANQWKPRLPVADSEFNWARVLIYWCYWVNSHREFELEWRINGLSPAGRSISKTSDTALIRNDDGDIATTDRLAQPSILRWLTIQRREPHSLVGYLDRLCLIAAESFHTGAAVKGSGQSQGSPSSVLTLGGKSLLCFSMNRWLSSIGSLRRDLENSVFSDLEFCRVLHGVATTSHYLWGGMDLTEDVIHRVMQLVARYGHGDLGIPRRLDLRAQLLHAARGEPALHSLKRFYRDHFFHALEVCFLGHVLLEAKLEQDERLWDRVAKFLKVPQKKECVLRLWYVAALMHDTGYAMDVLNSSREFLGFFKHSKALNRLCERFKRAVEELSKSAQVGRLGITGEDHLGQDHGVVGALHVQSLLKRIAQDDPSVNHREYEPAVRAIAMHNLRRHDQRIKFSKDPLAFLLALCDQLQEWRRPRLAFSTAPNWLLARLENPIQGSIDLQGPFKALRTNIVCEVDGPEIMLEFPRKGNGKPLLTIEAEYDAAINRNSGVFELWLDATQNFQRFDFEGLPLDIIVTYVTPYYEDRDRGSKLRQMDRLRNAAYETHMTCLEDWFPTERIELDGEVWWSNGAVGYRYDDANHMEFLKLDLRELTKRVFMTGRMEIFRDRLREWKHANDDRDFPGDYAQVVPE